MKPIKPLLNIISKIILLSFLPIFLFLNVHAQTKANTDIKQLVQDWNNAHTTKDSAAFSHLYDANILYYGSHITKQQCVDKKINFLSKNPTYFQNINGDISVDSIGDNGWKCTFSKRVTLKGNSKDFPSYLIFRKVNTQWKIVTEGDLITDRNIENKNKIPKDAELGDYNGDGKKEYMWLAAPKTTEDFDCIGDCDCYIKFSDATIPPIKIPNCIDGTPTNKGDLNKNGSDEIGLLPQWFMGCWASYHVWTFINGKWVNAVEPFSTYCDQWEKGVNPIEIDKKKDGYVIVRYTEFGDIEFKVKSKSVKIVR